MRALLCVGALALGFVAPPAGAAMGLEEMQAASGLADILTSAEHCGYTVDDQALQNYFVAKKLDTPEILAFIKDSMAGKKFSEKPNSSECTLSRSTAASIGVIAQ
ncbi:hypothetical protein SAMN05892877_13212 [Rhizobium subbaraonis]|uniref:YpeB-like protein with protease inhibitory function n=1 Tax=Rhizobium subbaraonis TaxID=908946 RepID=A0A285V3S6_9HYPH|nr:hypothetical protein [Rhizobium subbaraonis]SOC47656.1 hypothetical protein SAMN05892877_13212 [Rhizobium subbaraonis]